MYKSTFYFGKRYKYTCNIRISFHSNYLPVLVDFDGIKIEVLGKELFFTFFDTVQ